ncbi:hypothetical protein ZIOFF_056218 [Zingiber officinale]|uniref:phosphopyruvate hydratase n=1 Tax=Zingiber officinale TaxID=94328 RepID=A0A8J5FLT3_ZINOF|nr:hypothetical protein ZIOFF_056218 [Zingiber officinale]
MDVAGKETRERKRINEGSSHTLVCITLIAIEDVSRDVPEKDKTFDLNFKEENNDGSQKISGDSLKNVYKSSVSEYPIVSIEDPFHQDDWTHYTKMTEEIGKQVQIVGDDLLVTNPTRVAKAIKEKSCIALLLKVNQIGSVTESIEAVKMSKQAGWGVMASHRSGETEDAFILLRIEEELGAAAVYAGDKSKLLSNALTYFVITASSSPACMSSSESLSSAIAMSCMSSLALPIPAQQGHGSFLPHEIEKWSRRCSKIMLGVVGVQLHGAVGIVASASSALEVLRDLTHKVLERQLSNQQLHVILVLSDLSLSATVLGKKQCRFFTPSVARADFLEPCR